MTRFEVGTSVDGQRADVVVCGDRDLAARDECTAALMTAVRVAPTVAVDLARLTFQDSRDVHALVTAHRPALERGGRLRVVNVGGKVGQVPEVSGVGELPRPRDGGRDG
ncbi:STAS domain-containing protein [Dactylosporangium sp. NPDC000555]|uniref:STAS domain-containing protein n=1 Tax=Dactylosporangium sp. NPDC000555 TaxID=3154260 RepID=UPI00332E4142